MALETSESPSSRRKTFPLRATPELIPYLQERTGDQMHFAMTALPRPGVKSELVLFRELVAGGEIADACFTESDIGKRCAAWGLVVDFGTAEQRIERGVVLQRIVHGGAKRS